MSPDALPRAVEGQAVISTFYRVALDPSLGQRQLAVRTGVLKCDDFTRLGAIHADLFAQHDDLLQIAADLVAPSGHIPGILQKHRKLSDQDQANMYSHISLIHGEISFGTV